MAATHKLSAFAVAVVLVVAGLSGCGGADARRASHMARGQKYFAAGNFEKARVEFGNVLQIAPNDAEARYMAGRVAEKLGNLRGAAGMYQAAIDVNPEHVQARAQLARMYVFAFVPDKALELIKPAFEKHPDDADLLTVRGAARAQEKDSAGALADAEHAVKVAPTNENAVALLSSLYRDSGQTARAIELLNTTLKSIPDSVDLRQVLANLYLGNGDSGLAEQQMLKVVQIKPKELSLRYQLASYYISAKRLDDAERALKEAMTVAPDNNETKLAYVDFLTTQRSREQGERALRDFIGHNPGDYGLQLALGGFQQRFGATQEAVATYRAVIAKDGEGPSGLSARNRIATIDVMGGNYDEALKLVSEVLQKNPRDNDALTLRGNLALERGDAPGAIADLRAVLRDQPNATPVLRSLARAHLTNGEPALAEENLRAAMQAAPNDTGVRVEFARLLLQTRRAQQAIAVLETAVKSAPSDPTVREVLVRAYLEKPDLDAARQAADDLTTLSPQLAIGPYLAGLVAQGQKRPDDARKGFERALQLQPTAMDALAALARLELSQGHTDAALTRVRAVAEGDPKNALVRNLLGELYLQQRNWQQALVSLSEANRLAPKWWLPYRNLAAAKLASKDLAGCLATYEAGVKATDDPSLVTDLAALYERQGRIDEAIRQYEVLHEHRPQLEVASNNLAMLLVTYRKDQSSLDRARDLTAPFANSDTGALLDTHGWVSFKRGELPEALASLEKALAQAPGSRVIRYHLGMAQIKAGQPDKARANLQMALAGSASFKGIDEARSALAQLQGRAG